MSLNDLYRLLINLLIIINVNKINIIAFITIVFNLRVIYYYIHFYTGNVYVTAVKVNSSAVGHF